MKVRRLSLDEARRIAIRAQLLDADRPPDLERVVQQLTFLQLDPTAVVAPSADLLAWTRLGAAYAPVQLQHALERDRTLFEHRSQPTSVEPPLAMIRRVRSCCRWRARQGMAGRQRGLPAPRPGSAPRVGAACLA
jgi:uncharacterized protein YcaQ